MRLGKHASLATFLTFVKQRFTLKKSPTDAFVYGNAAPTSHGVLEPRRKHARAARTAAAPPPRRVQATSRTAPSLSTRSSPLAFLVLRASSGVRTPRRLVMRACCRLPDARCAPSSTSHGLKIDRTFVVCVLLLRVRSCVRVVLDAAVYACGAPSLV